MPVRFRPAALPLGSRDTAMGELVKRVSPKAKLVCVDVTPYGHTQAPDRDDILNVGGFADAVFDVVAAFARGEGTAQHWVDVIRAVEI